MERLAQSRWNFTLDDVCARTNLFFLSSRCYSASREKLTGRQFAYAPTIGGKNTQVRKKTWNETIRNNIAGFKKKIWLLAYLSIAWKMKRKSELDGSLICPKTQSDPLYFPYVNTARSSFSPPKFNMTNYNPAPVTWWIYMARLYIWIGYSYKADNKLFIYIIIVARNLYMLATLEGASVSISDSPFGLSWSWPCKKRAA